MTREEAIQWIRLDIDMAKFDPTTGEDAYLNDDAKKVIEAQEMAISTLKAQMDEDAISRQTAIDVIRKWKTQETVEGLIARIDDLPSAQPEIIRCKDCKYAHMTYNGECKYCDIWFPDEKTYMSGDYYCGSAERRTDG